MAKLEVVPRAFQIDKDVPLPPLNVGPKGSKYPWADMAVGDSVFIPDQTPNDAAAGNARWFANQPSNGWHMKCRSVDGGVRIWRVE